MDEKRFIKIVETIYVLTSGILVLIVFLSLLGVYLYNNPGVFSRHQQSGEIADTDLFTENSFADSIHLATGLIRGEHLELVIANCTGCHSSKLIIQNRATKDGWKGMIKWMQETQNLPELGENEEKIISYLATYYAPEEQGRRKPLPEVNWYKLE